MAHGVLALIVAAAAIVLADSQPAAATKHSNGGIPSVARALRGSRAAAPTEMLAIAGRALAARRNGTEVRFDKSQIVAGANQSNIEAPANDTLLSVGIVGINAGCFVVRFGMLLVVHRQDGRWDLPGGTGAPNEGAGGTAARETFEETGYRVSVGGLLTNWDAYRIFHCSVMGASSGIRDTHEIRDFGWLSADQLQGLHWRFQREATHYPAWMFVATNMSAKMNHP